MESAQTTSQIAAWVVPKSYTFGLRIATLMNDCNLGVDLPEPRSGARSASIFSLNWDARD